MITVSCGIAAATIGVSALIGHIYGHEILTTVISGGIAMRPITSAGFIIGGMSLTIAPVKSIREDIRSTILTALSMAMIVIIVLLVGRYVAVADGYQPSNRTFNRGMPSLGTIVAFGLFSYGMILRSVCIIRRWHHAPCVWLGMVIIAMGLIGLLGHVTDSPLLYWGWGWFNEVFGTTGMAINTCVGFVLLGAGLSVKPAID